MLTYGPWTLVDTGPIVGDRCFTARRYDGDTEIGTAGGYTVQVIPYPGSTAYPPSVDYYGPVTVTGSYLSSVSAHYGFDRLAEVDERRVLCFPAQFPGFETWEPMGPFPPDVIGWQLRIPGGLQSPDWYYQPWCEAHGVGYVYNEWVASGTDKAYDRWRNVNYIPGTSFELRAQIVMTGSDPDAPLVVRIGPGSVLQHRTGLQTIGPVTYTRDYFPSGPEYPMSRIVIGFTGPLDVPITLTAPVTLEDTVDIGPYSNIFTWIASSDVRPTDLPPGTVAETGKSNQVRFSALQVYGTAPAFNDYRWILAPAPTPPWLTWAVPSRVRGTALGDQHGRQSEFDPASRM